MARKKVKLALIANETARKATFKKRKKGLMKKVSELSTLCGVSACAIIYSPYDSQPDVWPSPPEAQRVIARFKSLPEMEQSKKMMNQEAFLRQRISKVKEQLKRQEKENRDLEITQLMNQALTGNKSLHDVGVEDLGDLAWMVEEKMKAIQERIELLTRTPPPPFLPVDEKRMMMRYGNGEGGSEAERTTLEVAMEALQRQSWFMDVMNPHEHVHVGCAGDDMVMPATYGEPASSWSNPFFP
ncbi:PREDICTED: agamous-like MADS-box protein AGL80 [Nelumbo nucifera]|uniref:MADS-box domain-containing protein n=2 Tax=Nelumbo nucifera TaxID=4432 RepID=A0A822YMT5_NELNU|nr:PREDICTED: agamous-like MADS-box protein AGL80 [Nelumbo nucifera]DAD32891.1 TPA_asm: hypothetical protein HUJ06_011742 [Nelumbo nucifera]